MSNTTGPEVVVLPDRDALVAAVVARFTSVVGDAVAARGEAHVVITGGGVGIAVLTGLRDVPIDWPRVHVWWGDERFLPAGDPERNETQARAALLDHVDVDLAQVHPMLPADRAADLDETAAEYQAELSSSAAGSGGDMAVPRFDVLLLGMGDDGHVASLFPGLPGVSVNDRSVVGVRDSPKPPPLRVSLTFPAIREAAQVWLIVAGGDKAGAVAQALPGGSAGSVPASGARGRDTTVWFLDEAAAMKLPSSR